MLDQVISIIRNWFDYEFRYGRLSTNLCKFEEFRLFQQNYERGKVCGLDEQKKKETEEEFWNFYGSYGNHSNFILFTMEKTFTSNDTLVLHQFSAVI